MNWLLHHAWRYQSQSTLPDAIAFVHKRRHPYRIRKGRPEGKGNSQPHSRLSISPRQGHGMLTVLSRSWESHLHSSLMWTHLWRQRITWNKFCWRLLWCQGKRKKKVSSNHKVNLLNETYTASSPSFALKSVLNEAKMASVSEEDFRVVKLQATSSMDAGMKSEKRDCPAFILHFWSPLTVCINDITRPFSNMIRRCLIFPANFRPKEWLLAV